MPSSFIGSLTKAAIIGSALLLSACSTLRVAYNSAPQLTWWWVDNYLDFSSDQSAPAREALDHWFTWHRQTQLTPYADWLARVEPQLQAPTTSKAVCDQFEQARQLISPSIEQAYVQAAALVPRLGPAQVKSLEARYAKNNAEYRKDVLQADPDKRRERSIKNALERFERLYGDLGEVQRKVIEAAARVTPFDPQRSFAEQERRQNEVLQQMRRWLVDKPTQGQALEGLRRLARSAETPVDAAHKAYLERLTDHSCKLTADVHNSTSTEQRAAARKQLRTWMADLRALAAERRDTP